MAGKGVSLHHSLGLLMDESYSGYIGVIGSGWECWMMDDG